MNGWDVDFDNRQLHARHGKGNKERFVALDEVLGNNLKNYKRQLRQQGWSVTDNAPVFSKEDGSAFKTRTVASVFEKVAKNSDSQRWSPHSWRRYYAKRAMMNGVPLDVLQANLGHASVSTTAHYLGTLELEDYQIVRQYSVLDCIDKTVGLPATSFRR